MKEFEATFKGKVTIKAPRKDFAKARAGHAILQEREIREVKILKIKELKKMNAKEVLQRKCDTRHRRGHASGLPWRNS